MEFRKWLRAELDQRGWNQAELARQSGLSDAAISRIMSSSKLPRIKRRPGIDACIAIATALEYKPAIVFEAAGYQANDEEISRERALLEFMISSMGEDEKKEIYDYIQFRLSKQKKR